MTETTKGQCLCGAVTVEVVGPLGDISACHCDLCTRWSGSVQMGIEVSHENVSIKGPIKTHQSSEIAKRAWCDVCGSAVFFSYTQGRDTGYLDLAPGLFKNFGGAKLARVVYADCCPDGLTLGGDHIRVTKAEYEAENPSVGGQNG